MGFLGSLCVGLLMLDMVKTGWIWTFKPEPVYEIPFNCKLVCYMCWTLWEADNCWAVSRLTGRKIAWNYNHRVDHHAVCWVRKENATVVRSFGIRDTSTTVSCNDNDNNAKYEFCKVCFHPLCNTGPKDVIFY
ncbi:uncharacterized protein LOC103509036 [Diaphorina citri]|uniref:Uncharacterized protein LOC103509036 n=1 Tax=Diaphorina citri TaxID=121845 RepID=A0A1S3D0Y3_DIACI|nr:uncharacterized protein LOC103509036 [Diaphorina citri]